MCRVRYLNFKQLWKLFLSSQPPNILIGRVSLWFRPLLISQSESNIYVVSDLQFHPICGEPQIGHPICVLRKSDDYAKRTSDLRITKYSIETSRIDLKTSRIDLKTSRIDLNTSRMHLNRFSKFLNRFSKFLKCILNAFSEFLNRFQE